MKPILTIELVPETSWYSNVRSNVSLEVWDIIRKKCYKKANYKCEICGGKGSKHPVECHEIWNYDDIKHTQTLTGFIALCPTCHKSKHIGLAGINGEQDLCINHMAKVNNVPKFIIKKHIEHSFNIWEKRSRSCWEVNIKFIDSYLED